MKVAISKPCHENWEKMTPNEQGVFCKVCTKNVIDFAGKSIEEIKSFFSKPMESRVCGRFREDQLDTLNMESFLERFIGMRFTRRVAMIVALAVVAWLGGVSAAKAQDDNTRKGKVSVQEGKDPKTVNTSTVTPTKAGMVEPIKDTIKCVKDLRGPKKEKSKKKDQSKTSKAGNTTITDPKKEENFIMGDVAPEKW